MFPGDKRIAAFPFSTVTLCYDSMVMSRLPRLLLILLVFFAMPLRGYAATSMQLCGFLHHGGMDGADVAQATHHDGNDSVHPGQSHNHPPAHHGDENGSHDSTTGPSSCSACGTCCSGATAPPGFTPIVNLEPASAPIVFIAQPFSGIVLENAERPPLTLVR